MHSNKHRGRIDDVTLFKRGRLWWTSFHQDGRRFQSSTGTANRRQAELIEQKLKDEQNLKRHHVRLQDPTICFKDLKDQYLSNGFHSFFHEDRLKHLLPFFGDLRISEITKAKVSQYKTIRQEQDGPLKESTLNRDIAVLRRILYWAVEEELILANPIARIQMGRERRTKKPVLSLSDEQKLLGTAKEHTKEIIITALDTGMRRGELLSQDWKDIDLERKLLFVTHSKTPEGEGREIPLTHRVFEMLNSKAEKSGPLFTFNRKSIQDLKTSWTTAQKNATLSNHFRFHDLRHTFNTRLMEAGVLQDVRMALMGHEPRTVHWGYTHVELPAKREAISKLERWIELQGKQESHKS
jgi:integrase